MALSHISLSSTPDCLQISLNISPIFFLMSNVNVYLHLEFAKRSIITIHLVGCRRELGSRAVVWVPLPTLWLLAYRQSPGKYVSLQASIHNLECMRILSYSFHAIVNGHALCYQWESNQQTFDYYKMQGNRGWNDLQ